MLLGKTSDKEGGWAREWFPLVLDADPDEGRKGRAVIDEKTGRPVRFEIQRIPDSVIREMRRRHFGETTKLRFRGKVREQDYDLDADVEFQVEYGSRAWVNSELAEWGAGDEEAAQRFTKALGRPVKAGEDFSIDGEDLRREARAEILLESESLRAFIVRCAEQMREVGGARQAAAGKGSQTGSSTG